VIEVMVSVPACATEAPTNIRRFVPDVVCEMVRLALVVIPVEVASTSGAAEA